MYVCLFFSSENALTLLIPALVTSQESVGVESSYLRRVLCFSIITSRMMDYTEAASMDEMATAVMFMMFTLYCFWGHAKTTINPDLGWRRLTPASNRNANVALSRLFGLRSFSHGGIPQREQRYISVRRLLLVGGRSYFSGQTVRDLLGEKRLHKRSPKTVLKHIRIKRAEPQPDDNFCC